VSFKLQATSYELQVTTYEIRDMSYEPRDTRYKIAPALADDKMPAAGYPAAVEVKLLAVCCVFAQQHDHSAGPMNISDPVGKKCGRQWPDFHCSGWQNG
jgi:hypothetical protein